MAGVTVPAKSQTAEERVEAGRVALARGAWDEARVLFEAAASMNETPEALEGLSWAAWWLDDAPVMFEARERAFRAYRARGDRLGAARMASWLGTDHMDFRGELAVAHGWLARARRLLEGLEPAPEHGWLWVHEGEKLIYENDTARARELGSRAAELGRRLGLVDLEMMGLATEGLALVSDGDVADGLARMDEAAAAALGEVFDEIFPAAWCCCYMLVACERLRDYDRAAQWCRRVEDWSERRRVTFVNRFCRAQYAGVLVQRGAWAEAEGELVECAERLAEIRPPWAAEATVRLAELRRRQGRLDEAGAILEQVGEDPRAVLGLGEVCLDRGDPAAARDRAEEYLRATPAEARALRGQALELLVRATAALGELERAAEALEELEAVASAVATDPLRAAAKFSGGVLASASGENESARASFEDAARLFRLSGAPFEAARVRVELAACLRALGRNDAARREVEAAFEVFAELGASGQAARAEEMLKRLLRPGPLVAVPEGSLRELSGRELEVLALIAGGLSNREIAERLVISEHTVKRHVVNILRKLSLPSRAAAASLAASRGVVQPPLAR
jgi:ATP/maltotriose-dependent transcriptional regulator MalT